MRNTLKARLKNGDTLVGPLVTIPSTDVAEIMSHVGFDYLWIEAEHAPTDFVRAQMMIQAAGDRCPCLVRIPENKEVWFKKALDIGCNGVVVPQVNTGAEARAAVECCLYPPDGRRSVGISRAHRHGMAFQDYIGSVNEDLLIVLQVEHVEGVRHIESILSTPGIGAVLVGPFDLSGSLGLLGQIDHPRVREAIAEIKRHCDAAGVPAGIFAVNPRSASQAIQEGFQLIALGMDSFYLWESARAALAEVRQAQL